jgi:tyrosine-protein phosphatase SIW14
MKQNAFGRFALCLAALALPVFAGSATGIKNFDKVDEHVYRGGQPTEEGFQQLAKLGVKGVIDLREADERGREEERIVTAAGMKYINVPMTGLTPPTEAEITRILSILEDPVQGPVFVHCKRGADRTGAVIAAYHVEHEKWDNRKALKDAMAHGMSYFQFPRQGYIRTFQARTVNPTGVPAATAVASEAR